MKYEFTDDMAEISGFGGGYEDCCRAMVVAGLEWLDEHPTAEPKYHGWKGVYGVIDEDNEDAKQLTKAVLDAAEKRGGSTGAMHQATIGHILWIRKNGWENYVKETRSSRDEIPA